MSVRVTYNEVEARRIFTSPTGPVGRYVEDLTRQVANQARQRAPVDTGTLRASISTSVSSRGGKMVGTVQSALQYAIFVHEGTGLFGKNHRVIKPRRKQVLRFQPRGGGEVFAKFVRGQHPQPFLVDALFAVLPTARRT